MRLLLQCGSFWPGRSGGVEGFAYGLVGGLIEVIDNSSHQLLLAVARGSVEEWRARLPSAGRVRIIEVLSSASLAASPSSTRRNAIDMSRRLIRRSFFGKAGISVFRRSVDSRMVSEYRADLVYYPYHRTDILPGSVLTVHDLRVLYPETLEPYEAKRLRANVGSAAAVVTSWDHPYEEILRQFPEIRSRLFKIPFPPMLSSVAPTEVTRSSVPILLYPAAVAEHKNHAKLLRAVSEVNLQRPVRLICTGPIIPDVFQQLRQELVDLDLLGVVDFTGYIPAHELAAHYASASVVVIPTLWEAASGPVFEAFARGRPVACSDIPPLRRQIQWCGGAARFFDPNDPTSIRDAILDVLAQPEPYTAGALKAATQLSKLNWAATAEAYLRVFELAHVRATNSVEPHSE